MTGRAAANLLASLLLAVLLVSGCGHRPAPPAPKAKAAQTRLPDWAPRDPSPEFLRAARVLRTMPEEALDSAENGVLARSLRAKSDRVRTPAWEFFGTLSDEEMHRLFAGKAAPANGRPASVDRAMTLRYKSLRREQQAALKRYLDVWRETYESLSSTEYRGGLVEDKLVTLYRYGAKEDLSNVQITFQVLNNHLVRARIYAVRGDGSPSEAVIVVFGYG